MTSSNSVSFQWLRLMFFCTVLVTARAIFDPNVDKTTPFVFPEMALVESKPLEKQAIATKSLQPKYWHDLEGYQYNYLFKDQSFNIKIHYLTATDGNIQTYLDRYRLDDQKVKIKLTEKQSPLGFYSLFEHEKTAYLSSCINSRGSSTITRSQFFANRNTYDLRLNRLLPVVLGIEDPRDTRCLWVTVSTPIETRSIASVHQQLETVWHEVYAWWMPRFPKL
jgi:cyanosortase A-associated protein